MAAAQNYASTPRRSNVTINTANPNRDGTGAMGDAFIAGANGSRVDAIIIQAIGTTTPGMVRLFEYNPTAATSRLIWEVQVTSANPNANTPAFFARLTTANQADLLPLILPNGWKLQVATQNAETFNVSPAGGDF